MKKLLHFQAKFEAAGVTKATDPVSGVEKEGIAISGYASTADKDRQDDIVEPSAFDESIKSTYKDNPIVLFQHKSDQPIGRVTSMLVDNKGLYVEAVIFESKAVELIRQKVLRTFSIGYIPKDLEYRDKDDNVLDPKDSKDVERIWYEEGIKRIVKTLELFEISVVSIPANAGALFSLAKSLDGYFEEEKSKYITNTINMKIDVKDNEVVKEEQPAEAVENEAVETPATEEVIAPENAEEVEKAPEETPAEEAATPEKEEAPEGEEAPEVPAEEPKKEEEVEAVKEEEEATAAEGADEEEKALAPFVEIAKEPKLVKLALDSAKSLTKEVGELKAKNEELEAKLAKTPAKQAKVYQQGKFGAAKEVEGGDGKTGSQPVEKKTGFKDALIGACND